MAKISQDNQIISWSADSKFLAFTAPNGRAMVVAVEGAKPPRQLVTEGANATFSPDGKWLAYSQEGVLKVAELTRDLYVMGDALTLARAAGPISRIMWMPDSKRILYEVERGSGPCYRTVELARGAQPSQPIELPARLILTQVLPDGSVVGTELVGGVIQRLDLRTRAQTWLKWSYQSIRPSPDGTRVAYVNSACAGMSQILVADAGLGNSRVLVDGGAIADLQWTADGKSIVYQTLESKYVIVPAGGGGRPQPTTVDVKAWPIRRTLSADGKFYRRVNDRNETCQTPVSGGFEECAAEGKRYAAFGRNFLFSLDGYGEGTMVFQIDPVTRKAQGVAQLKWTPAYATVAGADDRYLYLEEGETEYGAGIVRVTGLFRR